MTEMEVVIVNSEENAMLKTHKMLPSVLENNDRSIKARSVYASSRRYVNLLDKSSYYLVSFL